MNGYLVLVLLVVVGAIKARNSVNGTIEEEETLWFLSNLSVVPAMRAAIEYDIWYPFQEYYKNYPPYITFYHTGQNSPNLRFECNKEMYGQLYNKDLAANLVNEDNREQKSLCKSLSTTFANSHGRIEIQDFEPKTYFFSLGFECSVRRSLNCFQYNVTIYDESNTTRCVDLNMTSDKGQQNLIDHCEISYQYAAIPNQFGDTDLDGAISRIKKFLSFNSSEAYPAKLRPLVCEIVLPKCLPEENKILLPCRGDCKFYLKVCSHETISCDYLPRCEGRKGVTGTIDEYTSWFLSNLSVRPAMSASIQYNIRFREFGGDPIITFYYNGQDSPNLHAECNSEMHGQLFNENLAIGLGRSGHRENHWCVSPRGSTYDWDCYGRIDIQDFEAKSYSFSLGFNEKCDKNQDLHCLYYDVTIYDESNTTRCVDLNMNSKSQQRVIDQCETSYQYAAIPNQFGDTDLDGALSRINEFLRVSLSNVPSKLCLKKLKQIVCMIVLPKCLPEENRIILPCRDDCKFYMEGCLGKVINCDYLPPCEGRNSVREIITENTSWFLSNLSVRPAMTVSLEYHVQYPDVEDRPRPIITFYYSGQKSTNLHNECMDNFMHNKDLVIPLYDKYRENFWCNDKYGFLKDCHGRIGIQDFEPKSYFFSFGFECNETDANLKGLKYDVTIYDECNETSCPSGIVNCNCLPPREGKTVTGGIEEDTTWFLSNLSVRSAMSASIEYNIQYLDVPDHHRPIITFYYNEQNSTNLHDKCNSEMHGQLFNKDLVIPLCGRYTEKFWCNRKGWMKACHGRTKVQNFEPKSYFFSLGFKCNETGGNLKGLKYDVRIYDESNETSCLAVNMTELHRTDSCEQSYHKVAFPNPLGHTDPATAISALESFRDDLNNQVRSLIKYEVYLKPWNKCLKELKPFLCDIYLPQCLSEENKILLPCRDTCKSLMENCSLFTINGMEFNCDYLPPCPPTYPNYLIFCLSVGACVIVVVMVTVGCARNRKRISDACLACLFKQYTIKLKANTKKNDEPQLPRNREFDAFVFYHFDSDDIYVVGTIIPELEENRNFKLHIHSRDFTPGRDIKENIEAAIEGSNSAILLMSQGFVDG